MGKAQSFPLASIIIASGIRVTFFFRGDQCGDPKLPIVLLFLLGRPATKPFLRVITYGVAV